MKTTKKDLLRQAVIENLARESQKARGIISALDQALAHGQADVKDYGGAFEALHDITKDLETELTVLANEINREKWYDEGGSDHHGRGDAVEDQNLKGTGETVGDTGIDDAVQADQSEDD